MAGSTFRRCCSWRRFSPGRERLTAAGFTPEAGPVTRLRDLTIQHLRTLNLEGNELVHEALQRRGYPVLREDGGLWMPRGPHQTDLVHLSEHLDVLPVIGDTQFQARLELGTRDAWAVALGVLSVPSWIRRIDRFDPFPRAKPRAVWSRYTRCHHGHPAIVGRSGRRGGLDLGIALLVKVFPLVSVSSDRSCSGHGGRASIEFTTEFDLVWCRAVLSRLAITMPATTVRWNEEWENVYFEPAGGSTSADLFEPVEYTDEALLAMLNDLLHLGRRLLDADLSRAIREAGGSCCCRVLKCASSVPPSSTSSAGL